GQIQELADEGRRIDSTITKLESQQRNAELLGKQIEDLESRLNAAHDAAQGDRTALVDLVNNVRPNMVPADATADTALPVALDAHRTLTEQSRTITANRQAITAAADARRDADAAHGSVTDAEQALIDTVDPQQLASAEQAAAEARAQFDTTSQAASDARAVYSAAHAGHLQATNEADIARTNWDAKRKALRDAEEARGIADTLAALRQDVLADAVEHISEAATDLLQQFGGEHVAFHLDPDFVPCVELANGELRKTKLLSGGEKARAGLAFRLGIAMQAADGRLPDQIFGDEVTQYLDDEGRRAIIETINSLFASPILISHTSEIHDYATTVHHLERDPLGATHVAELVA
ncbi:MAG: hypothetical protein L0H59_01240, partial [Tomitella sp.]|nr:hypothetical protein [Tomitella sp.]